MREWSLMMNRKATFRTLLIVSMIMGFVFVGVSVIMLMENEPVQVIFPFLGIFMAIIIVIMIIVYFRNKITCEKLLDRQEAYGIDLGTEINEIEYIGTCGFSDPWLVYKSEEVKVFHASYIQAARAGRVRNGKQYTPGINLVSVEGHRYSLIVPKKNIEEVLHRIYELVQRHGNSVDQILIDSDEIARSIKVQWKLPLLISILLLVIVSACVLWEQRDVDLSPEVISEIISTSQYEDVQEYTERLDVMYLDSDEVDVMVYIEAVGEDEYFLEFQNLSELFVDATLRLMNENGEEITTVPVYMCRPMSSIMGIIELSENVTKWELSDPVYFGYASRYGIEYYAVDDYDDYYQWSNVILVDYSLENVEGLLKDLYGQYVLADTWYNLVYIYDEEDARTYEYNGFEFYDTYSAKYLAYIDLETRVIELYSFDEEDNTVLEYTWNME